MVVAEWVDGLVLVAVEFGTSNMDLGVELAARDLRRCTLQHAAFEGCSLSSKRARQEIARAYQGRVRPEEMLAREVGLRAIEKELSP
jgi:hypothetical protein